jgi:hypothetical protein
MSDSRPQRERQVARASLLVTVAGLGVAGWAVGVPILLVTGASAVAAGVAFWLTRNRTAQTPKD